MLRIIISTLLFSLMFQHCLFAEGTRTVTPNVANLTALAIMPSNVSGSYLGCTEDNRIYFNIANNATENFYFGFNWRNYASSGSNPTINTMYIKIFNPNGTLAMGPTLLNNTGAGFINTYTEAYDGPNIAGSTPTGYTPLSFDPSANGEHWIEIYRSSDGGLTQATGTTWSFAPFFDFTVATAAGVRSNGRVHSDKWGFVAIDNVNYLTAVTGSSEPTTYAYTNDQTILKIDFEVGFKPIAYNLAVNNYGVTNTGNFAVDRKSINSATAPTLSNGYKIFLNIPDASLYPPAVAPNNPTFANPTFIGCPSGNVDIRFYMPETGDAKFLLDLNGVAGYQASSADRIIELYGLPAGLNIYTWDGLNGLGATVNSSANFNLTLTFRKGRFNVPIYDAEINSNGFNIATIAPVVIANSTLFWDDSNLPNVGTTCAAAADNANNTTGNGIANTIAGTLSPSHAWSGNGNSGIVVPAPAVGSNETDGLQCSDFGNVRVINTYGWAVGTTTTLSVSNFKCLSLTGTVWDDANNSAAGTSANIFTTGETGTNVAASLYATLIDPVTGKVIESVAVAANGTYTFSSVPTNGTNLEVRLTNSLGVVASLPPVLATLPSTWTNTSPLSTLVSSTLTNITGVDFGVEKLPVSSNNTATSQINPNGTANVSVSATLFSATDADGTVTNVRIVNFPTNATSITVNGIQYTSATFPALGITIPSNTSGNPTQAISIDPIDGAVTSVISYVAIDNAGKENTTPSSVNIPFTLASISGNVYNDANGLTDNTVNGSALGNPSGTQLYANLLNSSGVVIASSSVNALTGAYAFAGLGMGNYTVQISTNQGTLNALAPATALPTNWANTGENIGTTAGNDATIDGKIAVTISTTNISNANFGIEQLPNSVAPTTTTQVNPNGNGQVVVTTLTGTDAEDVSPTAIQISSLPTNATLYYNGSVLSAGAIISNYNPALLTLDPTFVGGGNITFSFAFVDAAGKIDPTPATVSMNFTDISISGTVYDDANGLTDNTVNGTGNGQPSANQLYANLVHNGLVVGSAALNANGTYSLTSANGIDITLNSNYDVIISTTQGTIGNAVSAVLPNNWVVTGENLGSGAGNDNTPNASLSISLATTNISNANFGIEQLPNSVAPTTTTQVNPNGNGQVVVTTLTGTDAEDVSPTAIQISSLPTNATLYYNGSVVSAGAIISNYNPALLTLDPTFVGGGNITFSFAFVDAAGKIDPTPATVSMDFTDISISGTVYDDANGLTDNTVNGTGNGQPSANQLYANLVHNGLVVGSAALNANGTYSLTSANGIDIALNSNYDVIISTTQGTIGNAVSAVLPNNWVVTGENLGSGAGNDNTPNASLSISVATTNISNANFGIEQLPNSVAPTTTTQVNPNGNGQVVVTTLTGTDAEDVSPTAIQISSLPTNATLYYNGSVVSAGAIISNYNPVLLTLAPTFVGGGNITFSFAFVDAAGKIDPTPATVSMNFTDISISGTVYDDANGLTDNTVNGTGNGQPYANQLYANLVHNGLVVGSAALNANGTYSLTSANGIDITLNSNYDVIISTTQGTIGNAVSAVLPNNWVVTGENLGSGAGNDNTPNASLSISVATTNISNANFGIEQLPVAATHTYTNQMNPGGTLMVNVAATLFSAIDTDGTVESILLKSFPSNVTTLVVNGTTFTSSNFPAQGITIPVNSDGNPTQSIRIDPTNGAVTVSFPYVAIDNAGAESANIAYANLPFLAYPNLTVGIDDDNNTYINTSVSGNVLTNDFDAEGNTQTFSGFDNPVTPTVDYTRATTFTTISGTDMQGNMVADAGDLIINTNGEYTFIPTNGFTGVISVHYQVCDNGIPQACDDAILKIDVAPIPDPVDVTNNDVIANNDENVSYGQTITDNVLSNDNDPNENNIIFMGFENPNGGGFIPSGTINNVAGVSFDGAIVANAGSLQIYPNGVYNFTPTAGFAGIVTIPYLITDDVSSPATDNATLTIRVLPDANGNENDAPFAGDDFKITFVNTPITASFISNDNDPNADALSVNNVPIDASQAANVIGTYTTENGVITLYTNGTYKYTPNSGYIGNDQFTYQICDIAPQSLCTEGTIYITVSDVLQDFGDLPISFGIAKNLISTNIVNGVPVPTPSFWLGKQIDGEIQTLESNSANGDDTNNANGSTGDEDGLILPISVFAGQNAIFKVTVNSHTSGLTVYYGLWIDWDNNGVFEDFYTGSGVTHSPTTVNQTVTVPSYYDGRNINTRIRAFATMPLASDYKGTFSNGETEDFIAAIPTFVFPVELIDFKASLLGNDGLLTWKTASEINSAYFGVERSLDNGNTFETIAEVKAAENSQTVQKYEFTDKGIALWNLPKATYRLKLMDLDGGFAYSNLAELKFVAQENAYMNCFPNPVQNILNIHYQMGNDETLEWKIFDALGKVIHQQGLKNKTIFDSNVIFDFSPYPSGQYMIQLTSENHNFVQKIVVQ